MSMLRRLAGPLVLALALVLGATGASFAQDAQARFAFVIGNDGYEGSPLPTAANDAALVADALKASAFDVTGVRNLDQDTFRASYREFLAKVAAAGPAAVSVIYISGYGLQADGENYLVPPGASVSRDSDLALNAVRLSDIVRPLAGMPGRGRAMLLDLAYAGPFAKESQLPTGLAIVEPETGMIVAFNTAPGTWAQPGAGPYGPWAQALSEMLRDAGFSLDEALNRARTRTAELTRSAQVPWTAGRIEPPLVLLERKPDAPQPAVTEQQLVEQRARPIDQLGPDQAYGAALDRDTISGYEQFLASYPDSPYVKNVRGILAARREALTWRRTLAINTSNAYWSYLQRYPKGPHRTEARRRLARLSAPVEPPPSFEPVTYDVPPPPPVENAYFDEPAPTFYDAGAPPLPPSVFVAAPPPWWRPPPPPPMPDDSDYFLPSPDPIVETPSWAFAPIYVAPPEPPIFVPGVLRNPYVAIPAAVAAGIVAGKLINRVGKQNVGSSNVGVKPGTGQVGALGPGKPNIMAPTTPAPKPISFGAQPGRSPTVGRVPGQPVPAGPTGGQVPTVGAKPAQLTVGGVPSQPINTGPAGGTLPPVGVKPGQPAVGGVPGQPVHTGPAGGQLPTVGAKPAQPTVGSAPGQPAHTGPAGGQLPPVGAKPGQPAVSGVPGQPIHTGPAGGQLPPVGAKPGQPAVSGVPGQPIHTGPAGGQLPPAGAKPGQPPVGGLPGQPVHTAPASGPLPTAGPRPGQPTVGGAPSQPVHTGPAGHPGGAAAVGAGQAAQQQQQLQQQRALQMQQQQRLQQQQQLQQQRLQQQQQLQQQRAQQQQQQQRALQAQQQQRALQAQQQQRQQQQRMQAQQQQRQLQMQQQRMQAQQRQQQIVQQQRQQQMKAQQRQQQMMMQQRQQQQQQQQQRQKPRYCPPGQRC